MTSRILIAIVALVAGCASTPGDALREPGDRIAVVVAPPLRGEFVVRDRALSMMGTDVKIIVVAKEGAVDVSSLDAALDAAVVEFARVEDLMTDWRPSPLETLNQSAGLGPRVVPKELARFIVRAAEISELTEGAFDATYGAVGQLWRFRGEPELPDPAEVAAALAFVGAQQVVVDLERNTVTLPAGFRIGLGGIAKGYGVDRAMRVLIDHGICNALVNAGGDMKILGEYCGAPWEVAIRHPRSARKPGGARAAMAVLRLSNTCVVTSGDYERFFTIDGVRYHHILDPRTGYPATAAMSATVLAPDAAFADALATALCILGPERGLAIVRKLPRVEALIIDLAGDAHASPGLEGFFLPATAGQEAR